MIVVGAALVLFVGGSIALGLGPSTAPSSAPAVHRVAGAKLRPESAAPLLAPIRVAGQPPADIVDALALPAGTTVVRGSARNHGVETYDRSLGFLVDASQSDVIDFFRAELRADGWQQVSSAPSRTADGVTILGQHGAVDGNLWEIGVVVSPSRFTGGPASAGTSSAGTSSASTPAASAPSGSTDVTPFNIELYVRSLSA